MIEATDLVAATLALTDGHADDVAAMGVVDGTEATVRAQAVQHGVEPDDLLAFATAYGRLGAVNATDAALSAESVAMGILIGLTVASGVGLRA